MIMVDTWQKMTDIEKARFKIVAAELHDVFKKGNPNSTSKALSKPGRTAKRLISSPAIPLPVWELQLSVPRLPNSPRLSHHHRVRDEELRDLSESF
jgi:hypothetical protein